MGSGRRKAGLFWHTPQATAVFSVSSTLRKCLFQAASAAHSLKRKKKLNVFIAKSAQQHGYDIYEDRLKLLQVNNTPMMTYRILGFGGRMFAVPFVTRQVDWIGVDNPEKIPLP